MQRAQQILGNQAVMRLLQTEADSEGSQRAAQPTRVEPTAVEHRPTAGAPALQLAKYKGKKDYEKKAKAAIKIALDWLQKMVETVGFFEEKSKEVIETFGKKAKVDTILEVLTGAYKRLQSEELTIKVVEGLSIGIAGQTKHESGNIILTPIGLTTDEGTAATIIHELTHETVDTEDLFDEADANNAYSYERFALRVLGEEGAEKAAKAQLTKNILDAVLNKMESDYKTEDAALEDLLNRYDDAVDDQGRQQAIEAAVEQIGQQAKLKEWLKFLNGFKKPIRDELGVIDEWWESDEIQGAIL